MQFGTGIVEQLARDQLASQVIIYTGSIDDSNDATLYSHSTASDLLKDGNGEALADASCEWWDSHVCTAYVFFQLQL